MRRLLKALFLAWLGKKLFNRLGAAEETRPVGRSKRKSSGRQT
jgi:hypothetical protein